MRILELDLGGGSAAPVELHPNLTLIRGLEPGRREALADEIRRIPRAEAPVGGLVEAHGVVFDLTPASLRLLGLVDEDVDPVVGAADLPGHDDQADESAAVLSAARATRDERAARLDRARSVLTSVTQAQSALTAAIQESRSQDAVRADAVVRATTALAEARRQRHDARSRREAIERDLADAAAAHAALLDAHDAASDALHEARARHERAVEACADAAAAVRTAHDAVTSYERRVAAAHALVDEATSADDAPRNGTGGHTADRPGDPPPDPGDGSGGPDAGAEPDAGGDSAAPRSLFGRSSDVGPRRSDPVSAPAASASSGSATATVALAEELQLQSVDRRRDEVRSELDGLPASVPTGEIRTARDELVGQGLATVNPEAGDSRRLAVRWRELVARRDELAADQPAQADATDGAASGDPGADIEEPSSLAAARERLETARRGHEAAQQAANASATGPDDITALEAAHTAVLDAQERADSRFGGGKAQRRLAQARAEERQILDRLGFSTYADYMMSGSSRFQNSADAAVLDTAERALVAARRDFAEAWKEVHGTEAPSIPCPPQPVAGASPSPSPDPEAEARRRAAAEAARQRTEARAEVDAELASVRSQADALLDRPAGIDVAADLEAHARELGPEADRAGEQLGGLLAQQGIPVADEVLARGTLIEYADAWLDEQQSLAWRRAELEAELDQIDREAVRLHDALAAGRSRPRNGSGRAEPVTDAQVAGRSGAGDDGKPGETDRLTEAQQALDEILRSGDRECLAEELERRQADLEARNAEERRVAEELERYLPADDGEVGEAADRRQEIEAALDRAVEDERAAATLVGDLEAEVAGTEGSASHELAELEVRLDAVEQDRVRAEQEVVSAESELEQAENALRTMESAEAERRLARAQDQLTKGSLLEDIDWYLLSRLAAQRSVGAAGSMPLVVDAAFADLPATDANWLLGRLERMSGAVQIIVLDDRPEAVDWVGGLGAERGAVVSV